MEDPPPLNRWNNHPAPSVNRRLDLFVPCEDLDGSLPFNHSFNEYAFAVLSGAESGGTPIRPFAL